MLEITLMSLLCHSKITRAYNQLLLNFNQVVILKNTSFFVQKKKTTSFLE